MPSARCSSLRDLERRMRGAQPDERRRAIGELQVEAQQMAETQQRLSAEARRLQQQGSPASGDALRRMATEQEKLAERVGSLRRGLSELSAGAGQAGQAGQSVSAVGTGRVVAQRRAGRNRAAEARRPHASGRVGATRRGQQGRRERLADQSAGESAGWPREGDDAGRAEAGIERRRQQRRSAEAVRSARAGARPEDEAR